MAEVNLSNGSFVIIVSHKDKVGMAHVVAGKRLTVKTQNKIFTYLKRKTGLKLDWNNLIDWIDQADTEAMYDLRASGKNTRMWFDSAGDEIKFDEPSTPWLLED